MTNESTPTATTLNGIAAILQALVWPLVASAFLLIYRSKLASLFDVVILKLKDAKHVKAGQIEFDTEQEIHKVIEETGERAGSGELAKEVPEEQIQAAQAVSDKLDAAPIEFSHKLDFAHKQIYDLVDQYEAIRRSMPRSSVRTRTMNEIAAKMRAFSIAAYPLLHSLMAGSKPGARLAAMCFLQVKPELGYFDWLVERVMKESQPFLFFQSSLAILEIVKSHPYLHSKAVGESIRRALQKISSFQGGEPDRNTIEVLQEALSRLEAEHSN